MKTEGLLRHKTVNLTTFKKGGDCIISFRGNDYNHVTYLGKKDDLFLFKVKNREYQLIGLSVETIRLKPYMVFNAYYA